MTSMGSMRLDQAEEALTSGVISICACGNSKGTSGPFPSCLPASREAWNVVRDALAQLKETLDLEHAG